MAYLNFESLNEGFFNKNKNNKNVKKNCLPIDANKTYINGRILCANTHYLTGFKQSLQSSGVRYGALASILGGLIFGGIGAIPGLIVFLKSFYDWTVYPLIRQHNARDFMIIPMIEEENQEKSSRIMNDLNQHPVLSINDGKVVKVINDISNDGHYGPAEGNHIIISHYNDLFFSLYGHLYKDSITVQEGDTVSKGQYIGGIGNTGNSGLPHLHFEITYTHPDKYFSWGKNLTNFDDYMYTPINLSKIIFQIMKNDQQKIINQFKEKLKLNKSGELDNCCLVT